LINAAGEIVPAVPFQPAGPGSRTDQSQFHRSLTRQSARIIKSA
jgi:hypothetical protein